MIIVLCSLTRISDILNFLLVHFGRGRFNNVAVNGTRAELDEHALRKFQIRTSQRISTQPNCLQDQTGRHPVINPYRADKYDCLHRQVV